MAEYVDGVLKEWGDRLHYAKPKGRRGKHGGFYLGGSAKPATGPSGGVGRTAAANKQIVARTVRKTPEVMVKITGGAKDKRGMKAHLDYISRNADLPLEDQDGKLIAGRDAVRELHRGWVANEALSPGQSRIPDEDGYRKEAFNIMLSMPPGTPPEAVREAAKAFAGATFADHQYAFVMHTDEKHPHVHLCVRAVDRDGHRMNPRKADLQEWREAFAEQLRERGIDANATKRAVRGRPRRGIKQAVYHIDRDHQRDPSKRQPSRVAQARSRELHDEATGKAPPRRHPGEKQLAVTRRDVVHAYGAIASALAKSENPEDRKLALEIVGHVKRMDPPKSSYALDVERARHAGGEGRAAEAEKVAAGDQRDDARGAASKDPDRKR